jgi:hypothetical protein
MKRHMTLSLAVAAAIAATAPIAIPALATPAATRHTLHFDTVQVASHQFGKTTFCAIDKDVQAGKTIATDELDWSGTTATVALALSHGFLYGQFAINGKTGTFSGKVTGGTGAYRGDTGTISGHAISATRAAVTVTYHS